MNKNTCGPFKYDDDEDYVPTKKLKIDDQNKTNSANIDLKQHTLDSDEEDEYQEDKEEKEKYQTLKDDDIDGQEASTIAMEGETKITPFNMKEELEEGHFDKDGFYHFKKDDDLKDAWLDNVDWIKVKKDKDEVQKYGSDVDSESDGDQPSLPTAPLTLQDEEEIISIYKEIFVFLKAGETISKGLKRLGGNIKRLTSAQRWKLKKQGKDIPEDGQMKQFLELTELVNKIVDMGNMDVYEETYEMINLKLERHVTAKTKTPAPELDMFGDASAPANDTPKEETKAPKEETKAEQKDSFDEVAWEYRWTNEDSSKIHGPFTSAQMQRWKESAFFKDGVYVRKTCERDGPWYASQRIEFDLYLD